MAQTPAKIESHPKNEIQAQYKPFDNILNFRDVGKTINDFLGEKRLVEGRLFRSARPDDASPEDRRRLVEEFNIKTIIDLRTDTEHAQRISKSQASASTITTSSSSPPPQTMPTIQTHLINLNGSTFSRALLLRLPVLSIIHLVSLMAIGQRVPAIKILGEGVMQERGLIGLGYDSLDFSGKEIMEVLRICENGLRASMPTPPPTVIEHEDGDDVRADEVNEFHVEGNRLPAVLVHCTQGKDRTGLIILLILLILDIPVEAIAYDYGLSDAELVTEREARLAECQEMGLGEEFVGCAPGWAEAVVSHVQEKSGGVRGYLEGVENGVGHGRGSWSGRGRSGKEDSMEDVSEGLRQELLVR